MSRYDISPGIGGPREPTEHECRRLDWLDVCPDPIGDEARDEILEILKREAVAWAA